jgi:gamma-glutamyltranspeptidase/glutathione hydrolase
LVCILAISSLLHADSLPAKAAIASAHPLATRAGLQILKQGGNAFDASVAVTATLAVVEPYSSGLGGGGFWLMHDQKQNRDLMIDAREKAPLKSHRDMYLDKDGNVIPNISLQGPLAAGIPGIPAALVHIASQYGKLPLKTSLAPAIRIARHGYSIDETYRRFAKLRLQALQSDKAAAAIFLHNNDVPPAGYILKQPDLAKTLEKIAHAGTAGFYAGSIAQQLVDGVKAANGLWSLEDLRSYRIKERQPIQFRYHGYTITSASPPSSGGIALASILKILEDYRLEKMSSSGRKHTIIEAMRRAYADRARYLGDPDFISIPVKQLISTQHAAKWRSSIDKLKATPSQSISTFLPTAGKGTDTTHFSIIDRQGNRVAATLSINYPFGACFVPPGTGVLLNDEMDDFSAKPGVANAYGLVGAEANAIAPGKRPLSSMSPTFIESENGLAILGTPGGSRIITMVLLGILNYIDGMSAEQIVSAARFHHQFLPDHVIHEQGALTDAEISSLKIIGHKLKDNSSAYGGQGAYGNMQIVTWDKKNNTVDAASDPRGHGLAIVH